MNHLKSFLAFLLLAALAAGPGMVSAVAQIRYHVTDENEFVGDWQVLVLPAEAQPPDQRDTPFLLPGCHYFLHGADKSWTVVSIANLPGTDDLKNCVLTRKQIAERVASFPPATRFTWRRIRNYFVTEQESGELGFMWAVFTVDQDFPDRSAIGISLKAGDLIMQLTDPKSGRITWRTVLRKVAQ